MPFSGTTSMSQFGIGGIGMGGGIMGLGMGMGTETL